MALGESIEFIKEHPKQLLGAGAAVVALAVGVDMSSDYERHVVDPLQDKMTCVVDYMEVTGQPADPVAEVVVDVPAQPVPVENKETGVDCLESLEELLAHDYDGLAEGSGTLATVEGRPDLGVNARPEPTWAEIRADLGERLDDAQEGKAGHVARKFGGLVLKGAILAAAAGGIVVGAKEATKNVKQSFINTRELRRERRAERKKPVTVRSAPSIERTVEDTGDLSDVEMPANTSDGTTTEPEVDVVADYTATLRGQAPPSEHAADQRNEAWRAEVRNRDAQGRIDDSNLPNPSLDTEPAGPIGRWRYKRNKARQQ